MREVSMKNRILSAAALLLCIALLSCESSVSEKVGEKQSKECCTTSTDKGSASAKIPDESVYNLNSTWKTQRGESVPFNHFQGKVTVAAMVFTHCASACPRIVADIQRIEKSLSPEEQKQVQFLLISMDPERDTPERMQEFAGQFQLNTQWTLISSTEDATMEMANILGVRVKKLSDGGFDHSNVIHVINPAGIVVHQQQGLSVDPAETVVALQRLLRPAA